MKNKKHLFQCSRFTLLRIRLHMSLRKEGHTHNNSSHVYSDNDPMKKPIIVGCTCGNAEENKVWDDELGTYYFYYECKKCNYYWEGPIYSY